MIRKTISYFRSILPKTRKSHPISKLLRPLFEKSKIRTVFGVQITAFSALMGLVTYPTQAFEYTDSRIEYVDATEVTELITEDTFQFPLEHYIGTSQDYHRFHPGVDLRSPRGSEILPVAEGKVVEVEYLRYGYGHYVVIEHDNEVKSLYAHLDRVDVEEGDEVSRKDTIGTVGMTGLTTGPHLHLEMYQDNQYLSPKSVIREK